MAVIPSDTEVWKAINCGDYGQVDHWLGNDLLYVNRVISYYGRTCLHDAARLHQVEVIDVLIKGGCDVDRQDYHGNTALHWLIKTLDKNVHRDKAVPAVQSLLKAGYNLSLCDKEGNTALQVASGYANSATVSDAAKDVSKDIANILIKHNQEKEGPGKENVQFQKNVEEHSVPKPTKDEDPEAELAKATQKFVDSSGIKPSSDRIHMQYTLIQEEDNKGPVIEGMVVGASGGTLGSAVTNSVNTGSEFMRMGKSTLPTHFVKELVDASRSIALLQWSNGEGGTAFRVGSHYMMTNYHVVKEPQLPDDEEKKRGKGRWAQFDYDRPNNPGDEYLHLYFKPYPVVWKDEDMDIAILELSPTQSPIPPPLTKFDNASRQKKLHFVGHPNGEPQCADMECEIIDVSDELENELIQWSFKTYKENLFVGLRNPQRTLYQVSSGFLHGASGSPGFIIDPCTKEACIAVVHTRGFLTKETAPIEYIDPCTKEACIAVVHTRGFLTDKETAPIEYTVEQGVNLEAIAGTLKQQYPELWQDIFKC